MEENKSLYGLNEEQITQYLGLEKKFQARQIARWLSKGVYEIEQMTDLSLAQRSVFAQKNIKFISSEVIDEQTDDSGAVKLAVKMADEQVVECVLLTSQAGHRTACLSSQAGCAMGCKFCRTGTMKLNRNLQGYEIIEQYIHLLRLGGEINSIVFMGMGEPMANISNVLSAIEYFHNPQGINLSHRKITISTCGVIPGIRTLIKEDIPVKLAVSLVTADEDKRDQLMPVSRTFTLGMLKQALMEYQRHFGRRITFECCLISGVNTSESDAKKLAEYCKSLDVVVNLIPFNQASELDFRTPSAAELERFTGALDYLNVSYTRRFSRGRNVNGACGQLAVKYSYVDDEA